MNGRGSRGAVVVLRSAPRTPPYGIASRRKRQSGSALQTVSAARTSVERNPRVPSHSYEPLEGAELAFLAPTGSDLIALLVAKLQMPIEEAVTMFSVAAGCDPGNAPGGESAVRVTLCKECTGKAGLQVGLQVDETLPGHQMPTDTR
jgi:hypothetical protein